MRTVNFATRKFMRIKFTISCITQLPHLLDIFNVFRLNFNDVNFMISSKIVKFTKFIALEKKAPYGTYQADAQLVIDEIIQN